MHDNKNACDSDDRRQEIAMRFERAVFLIGVGLRDKDASYERNPHEYPYSESFRHGLGIFAALCAEFGEEASVLATLSESSFIRYQCTKDVADWSDGWLSEAREAVRGCKYAKYGPLASVEDGFFSPTEECFDLIMHAEDDVLGGFQERSVYEYLIGGTQEQYVVGRRFLLRHPLLDWDDYHNLRAGVWKLGDDPLDKGEASAVDPEWMSGLVEIAYEEPPDDAKLCPRCGWSMTRRGIQTFCSTRACVDPTPDFESLDDIPHRSMRLNRGVMRYITVPGALELRIAQAAKEAGLEYVLWPDKDVCDIQIESPDGVRLAIDAKDYCSPTRLARQIAGDRMKDLLCADEGLYVIPDETRRKHPGFEAICNNALSGKHGYSCVSFGALVRRMRQMAEGGRNE